MTSQKSLKNNVNLNDFKRSLLGSILFPAIALVVLFVTMTIPVMNYVTSEEFLMAKEHFEVTMFISPTSISGDMAMLLPLGMVVCGMLTAIKSFYFMLRKNQVNVFFSLGITRKTMFVNRTIAGLLTLFVAVLVPMAVIYIINISVFGYVAHATSLFFYIVSLLFVCGFAGFAIGGAATMISGNIFEVALTSFSATLTPMLLYSTVETLLSSYLKGFASAGFDSKWLALISPWHIATSLSEEKIMTEYGYADTVSFMDILGLVTRDTSVDKYKIPEAMKADMDFFLPILVWIAISVVILGAGYAFYKARKAEHANSFGHFAISRGVTMTLVFSLFMYYVDGWTYPRVSPIAYFAILVLSSAVAYFLLQLVMTRKIKATLKSFKYFGVLVGITAVFLVVVSTGVFGTYNKTPEKAEIKSVSIEASAISPYEHYIYPWNGDEDFVESETDESKETIIGLFDKIKNEKVAYGEDAIAWVTFAFRDKEDELKYRNFGIYSDELYMEYLKAVYSSDFFDLILKEYLINDPKEPTEEGGVSDGIYYYGDQNNSAGHLKVRNWAYISNTNLYPLNDGYYPEVDFIEDNEALCKALYNDLTKLTFEQLVTNNSKPVGILSTGGTDYMGEEPNYASGIVHPVDSDHWESIDVAEDRAKYGLTDTCIPVYPEMTETIAFLQNSGYDFAPVELTVKEVLYSDSPLNIANALFKFYEVNDKNYDGHGDYSYWSHDHNKVFFASSEFALYTLSESSWFITEDYSVVDMLKKIYKDAGHPLKSVTDTAKAEQIANKSVSQYMVYGNNGRYVYVVYEEGPVVCYYLPEANVSVLK